MLLVMVYLQTGVHLIKNTVNEISSQAMPIVDVPNISPDIYDDKNQKIDIPFYNLTRAGTLMMD